MVQSGKKRITSSRRVGEKASIVDYLGQKTSVATRDEYAIGYANKRVYLRLRTTSEGKRSHRVTMTQAIKLFKCHNYTYLVQYYKAKNTEHTHTI